MPRPSLERTLKYIPVVPRAHSKLGREARRGSHDLRKLVGHANFLDTLMDQLGLDAAEEQPQAEGHAQETEIAEESTVRWGTTDSSSDDEWETDGSSSAHVSDDEEPVTPEFDNENDHEHALDRTHSHTRGDTCVAIVHTRPVTTAGAEYPISVSIATREIDEDEMLREAREAGTIRGKSVVELGEEVEDYFVDKNFHLERAQLSAALSSFDVGTTARVVTGGA